MSAALRYFLAVFLMLSAVIATAASVDAVRFAASPAVTQMRIEVRSSAGTAVYDSGWREGNVFDWSAATLPYGSYAVRIFTRDLEGRAAEKQATLRSAPEGVSIDGAAGDLKLTTTLHDGETGQLITTSGDLSFRFGDFLNRKDVEVMRLSAQGDLDVAGVIRTGNGIMFPDGSIQRSAAVPSIMRQRGELNPVSNISGAGTPNQVTKWFDSSGTLGDSTITEVSGKVGIGTTNPGGQLHIFGSTLSDVFAGMGPDVVNGPGFNYGYAGGSFGVGAGFFNVRPATGATGVNPSLRFMTVDQQRMIITNAGNVGIGTGAPSQKLEVAGSVKISGPGSLLQFTDGTTQATAAPPGPTGPAGGDLSGTYPNPTVASVGGQTAANVASGAALANAATNLNTASTIVKRDGSGNFSAGTITASLSGNATTATTATNFSGSLNGEVTGTQGATVVSNADSNNTANAIVRRDASGNFSAGTVTLAGNLALPTTTSASVGVITLGGNPFVHDFGSINNTFLGTSAGNFTMTGGGNTASGYNAVLNNTTGNLNTASGYHALSNNTTGSGNIGIGSNAGQNLTTGSNNIDIGNGGLAAEAGTIRIGTGGTQTRAFIAGIRAVTTGAADAIAVLIDSNGQLGTVSSSRRYKFDINDMANATDGLMRLRPVSFRYRAHGDNAPLQYGLIAEEVAEVYPELVARNKDGEVETVMYQFLAPMLLNEVQKQQRTIDRLEQRLEALEKQLVSSK